MGAISFDPPSIPLVRQPIYTIVRRYLTDGQGNTLFITLPNVVCLSITQREGADPGDARFRYITSDADPTLPYPTQFEDLYPITATSPYRVNQDDRLVVTGFDGQGGRLVLFDGFAQVPELTLNPEVQEVAFTALGVAVRLWDSPAEGALYRDTDAPQMGDPVPTPQPPRFNPNDQSNNLIQPNATAAGFDTGGQVGGNGNYPLFLDPKIVANPDPRRLWTLGMAIRYLLWRNNPNQTYVINGDTTNIDAFLQAFTPTGAAPIDVTNPNTYNTSDIIIRDYDVGNQPAIEAIAELLEYNGFACRFGIETDPQTNLPKTTFRYYRKDGLLGLVVKNLYLDDPGMLDPAKYNVGAMQINRDTRRVANRFVIETAPVRYEISVILAPLFNCLVGDESDANRKMYLSGNWDENTTVLVRDAYRVYGFDECGDGHYDLKTRGYKYLTPGDLSFVLGVDDKGNLAAPGKRYFVHKYRPALSNLIQRDKANRPLKAQLALSRDYNGPVLNTWNGTGTWQPIDGGWQLLPDRLGIRVTVENPEEWSIGEYRGANVQNQGSSLRGVTSMANPTAPANGKPDLGTGTFFLRLTCVIEADVGISAVAERRATSPTRFAITRQIDARDHFLKTVVHESSVFAVNHQTKVIRDDTPNALAYANQLRAVHETAPAMGSVTIPRFTDAYSIGDQIRGVAGRNASFRSNAGAETGERPQYPTVTAITWTLDPQQSTTLTLTTRLAEPAPPR